MERKVILRADASPTIGMGHFIRTLALAEMLRDDFYCVYATRKPTDYQKQEINQLCKALIELPDDNSHYQKLLEVLKGDEIVVLDNYYFDTEYQKRIKEKGCKVVCIDDMHDKHYVADVVINHAPGLVEDNFSVDKNSKILLGLKYALLRKQFNDNYNSRTRCIRLPEHLLITFGGADFNNLTCKYLLELNKSSKFNKVSIITGVAYTFIEELKKIINSIDDIDIYHHSSVNVSQIIKIVENVDIAIAPSSTILYELIHLNVPVLSGYYTENQINIYKGFAELDVIFKGNDLNDTSHVISILKGITSSDILNISEKQMNLFDGLSGERIKTELMKL